MITTTLEAAFAILAVEFALLVPLVAFFSLRGARAVAEVTTSEATELVTKVADTEDSRRTALETVFREKYKYDGDELDAAVDEFMAREKAFYNAVVGAVLGRGETKISDINDELTKVVAPWISITPKNMVDAESADAVAAEKERIEIELGSTKDTLEKMIAEYNRAFRVEAEAESEVNSETKAETEAEAGNDPPAAVDVTPDAAAEPEAEDEEEIDYKTEELHDLDEVLEAIAAKKDGAAAPADQEIVNLDDSDEDADVQGDDAETAFAVDAAEVVAAESDDLESLEELDELDDDVLGDISAEIAADLPPDPTGDAVVNAADDVAEQAADDVGEDASDDAVDEGPGETPDERAGKPMTADDLDELMESLDAEAADETEPV